MSDKWPKIRINQRYQSIHTPLLIVEVVGKKGDLWKTRILTEKHGVYAGSHTFTKYVLRSKFRLLDNKQFYE